MEQYGDQVQFFGVAGRDDLGAIQGFIDEEGVSGFDHIVDETGEVWAEFGVASQPAFVFLNQTGDAERIIGALGESGLASELDALIAS